MPESEERLNSLAEALGVDPETLRTLDAEPPPPTPFSQLPALVQEAVYRHHSSQMKAIEDLAVQLDYLTRLSAGLPVGEPMASLELDSLTKDAQQRAAFEEALGVRPSVSAAAETSPPSRRDEVAETSAAVARAKKDGPAQKGAKRPRQKPA